MKIDFTDEQLALVKEILEEYAEMCYQEMFDYKRIAVDADDSFIREQYDQMANAEEDHFNRVKSLSEYIVKYEDLMRNV